MTGSGERPSNGSPPASAGAPRSQQEIPLGYCQCGCGRRTELAKRNLPSRGYVEGQPLRFIQAHQPRRYQPGYRVDPDTGCWIWTGLRSTAGYGRTGPSTFAHREYYEKANGPIPDGLSLDHLCRTPACVNPDHLEPVTHAENLRRGNSTKLTWAQVREIRASSDSCSLLADRFGVAKTTIRNVLNGKRWKEGV